MSASTSVAGIPLPIVTINRGVLVAGILTAALSGATWLVFALFILMAPAALFGKRASLIYQLGSRLLPAAWLDRAGREDARLVRFNNIIATLLLGAAAVAFASGFTLAGWVLAGMVAVAATVALLGFCVGCFLFLQFNLARYRLFARL